MRMRIAAVLTAACLVALGGLLSAGIAPQWLTGWAEIAPGGPQMLGLIVAASGLYQLGRRRSHVRFVSD